MLYLGIYLEEAGLCTDPFHVPIVPIPLLKGPVHIQVYGDRFLVGLLQSIVHGTNLSHRRWDRIRLESSDCGAFFNVRSVILGCWKMGDSVCLF